MRRNPRPHRRQAHRRRGPDMAESTNADDIVRQYLGNASAGTAMVASPAAAPSSDADTIVQGYLNQPSATPAAPPPYNPVHDCAVRLWNAPTTEAQLCVIRNALQPAPNTTYGDVLPVARPTGTEDWTRLAMPNFVRSGLTDILTPPPMSQGGGLINFTMDESGNVRPTLSAGSDLMITGYPGNPLGGVGAIGGLLESTLGKGKWTARVERIPGADVR